MTRTWEQERKGLTVAVCGCQGCAGCKSPPLCAAPFDVEIHEMELCSVLKSHDDSQDKKMPREAAMDDAPPDEEDEDGEVEEERTKTQDDNQDATGEDPAGGATTLADMTH